MKAKNQKSTGKKAHPAGATGRATAIPDTTGLLTRRQFADLAGVKPNYVNACVSKGLVILDRGKVDPMNDINALFLAKRNSTGNAGNNERRRDLLAVIQELKEQQLLKTRAETEILALRKSKMTSDVLPISHAQFALTTLAESINAAWENEIGDFLMTVFAGDRERRLEHQKRLLRVSNIARERAVKLAKSRINEAAETHTKTRGKGEKRHE
jgi:phage terminase Nu1 subunit (DNA packaging protein)